MINKKAAPFQALPNHQCPLCGGPNGCASAASGSLDSSCWCTEIKITPELLARVPEALRNKACICRNCAAGEEQQREKETLPYQNEKVL